MDDKRRIALVETRTQGTDDWSAQLTRYQFENHLGSASLELDDANAVISYEEYYPYGSTSYQAVRSQPGIPKRYRYTEKERDEESGLYYHGARYYTPWLCRWLTIDPLAQKRAWLSPYNYVQNNPVTRCDSTGALDHAAKTALPKPEIKHFSREVRVLEGPLWDITLKMSAETKVKVIKTKADKIKIEADSKKLETALKTTLGVKSQEVYNLVSKPENINKLLEKALNPKNISASLESIIGAYSVETTLKLLPLALTTVVSPKEPLKLSSGDPKKPKLTDVVSTTNIMIEITATPHQNSGLVIERKLEPKQKPTDPLPIIIGTLSVTEVLELIGIVILL
jgi:RHS repeat-associated protein